MKSKKVTMLAAALVVAVVALAGVGYATTAYTAKTTNGNNTAQATYLIIEQVGGEGTAAYNGDWLTKVFFDTENTGSGTNTFTLKKEYVNDNGSISKTASDPTMALISIPLKISVTKHNSGDTTLDLSIKTTDLKTTTQIAGLTYYIAVGTAATDDNGVISMTGATLLTGTVGADSTVWNGSVTGTATGAAAENETITFDLLMFIAGAPTASPGEYAGFSATSSFEITVTGSE